MAIRTKKWEEWLSLDGETAKTVSYADYFSRRPLFSALQIKNVGEELVENVTLKLTNENGMLLPCEKTLAELPFESVVQVELGEILSPHYFSSIEEVRTERITATLQKDKQVISEKEFTVTALPFDYWQGR